MPDYRSNTFSESSVFDWSFKTYPVSTPIFYHSPRRHVCRWIRYRALSRLFGKSVYSLELVVPYFSWECSLAKSLCMRLKCAVLCNQFQSRLMQNRFSTLLGARFQEIYLKISYSLANAVTPDVRLPDVVGTITRAQAGFDAAKAMREISAVGQFVSNNARAAHFHENGILKYAQRVTELDITFLEQIRDEVAEGIDAFYLVASMGEPTGMNQIKLASYLLSILECIAARVEAYYGSLSQESIYGLEIENNPARTRWHSIRQKIRDRSFFVLSKPLTMPHNDDFFSGLPTRSALDASFAQILASAQHTIQSNSQSSQSQSPAEPQQPRRLADMHTARAAQNSQASSTFESQQQNVALKHMSNFISANMSNIRRLSRLPAKYDFSEVMVAYGK
jgi:hypothetical protein